LNSFLRRVVPGLLSLVAVSGTAPAREVDWTTELATDVAFALGTVAANRHGPQRARYVGDEFPTQKLDDEAHERLHGDVTAPKTTAKERRAREFSNVTVVGAAGLPAAMAFAANDDKTWGRIMTTSHALIGGGFVGAVIKHQVGRPRPKARQDPDTVAQHDDAASFPSGHAEAAFTGATLVACFFPESPWWVHGAGWSLAVATALFRIQGDKHFLTDVTTGAALGVGVGLAANAFYEKDAEHQAGLGLRVAPNAIGVVYKY
jgi:membrane-associated phospholipid phosphatase